MIKGKKIYENLERLAYAKDMTINSMCKAARVSSGIIGDLKHDRRNNLGDITLAKLTKVLECEKEDIMNEAEQAEPMPEKPIVRKTDYFIERAVAALNESQDLRRLVRAAMRANDRQVRSTAILLESIVDINQEEGFGIGDGE